MALMRLAAGWRRDLPMSVLTVDHGLRPEAAAEARQVAGWCAAAGLPHVTLRWENARPATGLQARARQARYDLMSAWCRDHDADWLLTAHTQDDQAETVLMRLARTSSLDSLAGILRETRWNGVGVFRPLLDQSREALRRCLRNLGQAWIEDPSNVDLRFERVRIRHALPALAQGGITAAALAEIARQAGCASEALWAVARGWVAEHVAVLPEGYGRLPAEPFAGLPAMVQARVVAAVIRRFGGSAAPEPHETEALARWIGGGSPRRTLGGALFARRRDVVIVGREPGRIAAAAVEVPASGEACWDNRFAVMAPAGSHIVAAGQLGGFARLPGLPAFVQAGLPAVIPAGQPARIPHFGGQGAGNGPIAARFLN
jgi:tRNA(Ile)-lysidine synthase